MEQILTFVTCDRCNVDEWLPRGAHFIGFIEQALENGWEEVEYGVICPECVAIVKRELADDDTATHGAMNMSEVYDMLTPKEK